MSSSRSLHRRADRRAFRPSVDGRLEDRVLLTLPSVHDYLRTSTALLRNPSTRLARNVGLPPFLARNAPPFNREYQIKVAPASRTLRGGQAVEVAALDGSHYRIQLSYISNTPQTAQSEGLTGFYTRSTTEQGTTLIQPISYPQPQGTVRAYAMADGRVGIIVDGSTENTELSINPLPFPTRRGYAHSFAYGEARRGHLLNIGQITITSGRIGAVLGFHTAQLSGPLIAADTTPIDRIAFHSILPGASIVTGGDVNTLDVLQGLTLNTGTSIQIGRDLNLLNVGQDIVLENGSGIFVKRDLGLVPQPPKGTGTGTNVLTLNVNLIGTQFTGATPPEVATYIQGDVLIGPGSGFVIGRSVDNPIYIQGSLSGGSRLIIPQSTVIPVTNTVVARGGITP